jgi:endogenous inhibitor of DNA gyrase (YacG/DUF329 family)
MSDPTCPICRRALPVERPATHPFCSARCKMIDLGNWLDDRYVIAGPGLEDVDLDDEALAALLREPS